MEIDDVDDNDHDDDDNNDEVQFQPGDGLVWFGDTAHFAYGGNRRVVSP